MKSGRLFLSMPSFLLSPVAEEDCEVKGPDPDSSSQIRDRVRRAREFAKERSGVFSETAREMILSSLDAGLVTARGAFRLRRVARTISDLSESAEVGESHVAEALGLRGEW